MIEHPPLGELDPYGQSAPPPHEIENSEKEADKHHERDKPLIALGAP